jgi:hypothetical protein
VRIPAHRLDRQLISRPRFAAPAEVVAWFGAMQAQDYLAALWALGLRTPKATEATIDATIAEGRVIRTHLFRGTWQYVAREDVRWMLDLVGARLIASWAPGFRRLGLDHRTLGRCGELWAKALAGGRQLTRREMAAVLARGRIAAASRLSSLLGYAELAGVIASGGRRDKQTTWALLDDRVPASRPLAREEALAELARRYFQSHGPATIRDFAWWTGLPLGQSREALELAKGGLNADRVGGETYWLVDGKTVSRRSPSAHLLPAFDEYLVGYRERSAVLDRAHASKVNAGGGMLSPAVVIDGRVVGTWRRALGNDEVAVTVRSFGRLNRREREALAGAADRHGRFLGVAARVAA